MYVVKIGAEIVQACEGDITHDYRHLASPGVWPRLQRDTRYHSHHLTSDQLRVISRAIMFRKTGVEKRLRKISRNEAASIKLLESQESELCKALDENSQLIEKRLSKQSPGEVKITQEVEKLSKRLTQLNIDLEKMRLKREDEVTPLRVRGEEMAEKLKMIRNQLESVRSIRERSLSLSSLDTRNISINQSPPPCAPPSYNETCE